MRQKPLSCEGCSCASHGTDFTRVDGTGSLSVMIVAEASGEMEAREGIPLVPYAPAGSVVQRTLTRMGLSRAQFSWTNCLRCRPKNNFLVGSPWEFSALNHCRPNLDVAIAERRPKAILALGDTALRELTGEAGEARGVGHLCGYVLKGPGQHWADSMEPPPYRTIPVIPAYHPAFIRRGKAAYQGFFSRNLQRAINVASGKDREWIWDLEEGVRNGKIAYDTRPSLDDVRGFVDRVESSSQFVLSYDIETFESASLDEDARDGFTDTQIRLIQFSVGAGTGIALPWEGAYRECARRLLHTPNTKCGHNLWLFDNRVLRAAGEREGLDLTPRGTIHDTLQMFHHWQPDLPAHLQFAAQFVQFPFPWKHLAGTDLEFYGCVDVDATLRLYNFLVAMLQKDQIWCGRWSPDGWNDGGYIGQVQQVRPVLAAMEDRGLPVDDAERLKLDGEFDLAQQELNAELQSRVPLEVLGLEPRRGKKGNYEYGYRKAPKDLAGLVEREFEEATVGMDGEPTTVLHRRWCRIVPFNPNSWQQLLKYMDARGHKRPKSKKSENEDGSPKDTTEKKELIRLAQRHSDTFYLKVIEYRELSKARGTYVDGFKPHDDGRVHTTFTFDTGTGQTTSRNPNCQNFPKHGRLSKQLRKMIAAPDGYELSEWDYKSYHVLTTGFCAEDASYMRMARLDMHSFVAGCFTKDWKPEIAEEDDASLLDRFAWFKSDSDRKRVRDKQAKPTILGVGFGMGARRLFQENLEHFPNERTAKSFLDLLQHLYPRIFDWQARIRKLAHEQTFLRSPFGHIRRFYEVFVWDHKSGGWKNGDQAEEAVAFLPANYAFGNIRETMKMLDSSGAAARYGLMNTIHDSVMFCYPREMREQHIAEVYPILTAPSKVLIHSTLAPDGLSVDVEANFGANWSQMEAVDVQVPMVAS
jgi:uracil-DNA glycosylase family 4